MCKKKFISAAVAIAGFLFQGGCSKQDHSPPPTSTQVGSRAEISASAEAEHLPQIGGVQGYLGSDSCKECHKDEHASWYRTYHRTMTQVANTSTVVADFNDVILTNDTTRFHLSVQGSALKVKLQPAQSPPDSADVPTLETEMGLVTGSHHMQVFWLPEGSGNVQIGFPFTWLIPEKRWVPRSSTFIRPPETPHRPEFWNMVCSRCHTTGVEPHINLAERTAETKVAELGISCEACHGPGEKHVTWHREKKIKEANASQVTKVSENNTLQEEKPALVQGDPIIQPKNLSAERSSQVCGFCHSMKWFDQTENWRHAGFQYRPGDDLEKTTPIIRPSYTDDIPALAAYLKRSPDLLNDFFWPDGMIRVSGRELNGLIESPCYKSKQFSCVSCHSMHESEPAGLVSERAKGNGACIQCHDQFASREVLARHTHHAPESSGSSCYNCHMPFTTYGVLKGIRSHQISNPKVEDQLRTGRPNACNLCHLDKTLQWTADTLSKWYDHEVPELPDVDRTLANSARLALEGDAGQRAIMAWHLGWDEALNTSGRYWTPILLAQLLDDPYAAVRCVAERSLRNSLPGLEWQYDFTQPNNLREPAREVIWATVLQQQKQKTNQPQLLFFPESPEAQQPAFDEVLRRRNHRPMRLRE